MNSWRTGRRFDEECAALLLRRLNPCLDGLFEGTNRDDAPHVGEGIRRDGVRAYHLDGGGGLLDVGDAGVPKPDDLSVVVAPGLLRRKETFRIEQPKLLRVLFPQLRHGALVELAWYGHGHDHVRSCGVCILMIFFCLARDFFFRADCAKTCSARSRAPLLKGPCARARRSVRSSTSDPCSPRAAARSESARAAG